MDNGDYPQNKLEPVRNTAPLDGRCVLIVVENLPVPFDRRVWMEARTLKAAGAAVSVICPTGAGYEARFEQIEGIDIYRHPLPADATGALGYFLEYSLAIFWELILAVRVLKRQGIDIIHGCNPPDLIFLVALVLRPFGVRYIFDHHDINPELYEAKFRKRGILWRAMKLFELLTFKSAAVSIATNESYRKIAIERGGMEPQNVFVVRSGPDLNRLHSVNPNPQWRNGRSYLVGYVGVMGQQEGIELLLDSIKHLVFVRGRTDVQFVLVGDGPAFTDLNSLATKLGVAEYVTFTGRVPDNQLFEVLSTADICVNPDRVNPMNDKSTMNKILEYMAFAKPIVQFDVTEGRYSAAGSSFYARPNDIVHFAELVEQLLDDPVRRTEMGREGRSRIEELFSWPHQEPHLIAAYRRALEL